MKGQATVPESPMANALPDEELMSQVRNGIGEMLGVLFDRYQVPLFNFYCKLTGNRTLSEDLVQDVFFRILKYRHTYAVGTPFRAWMYQIARNARVDHFRRSRPETALEPEMSPVVHHPDFAQQDQEANLLHRALMHLSEEKREVLILARFQELKYSEIATLLGCEVNSVKVKVHRAVQELKETFQRLERGDSLQQHSEGAGWPRPGSLQ
jgi:RNA polymerase sigma-70 factor, ECF subfamily